MKPSAYDYMKIGEYQFKNLLNNPIQFLLIDLRTENKNPFLAKAQNMELIMVKEFVIKQNAQKDAAIVIICEDGQKSSQAASDLATIGFINVVILDGGTNSLIQH